jgi:hypothetical protein
MPAKPALLNLPDGAARQKSIFEFLCNTLMGQTLVVLAQHQLDFLFCAQIGRPQPIMELFSRLEATLFQRISELETVCHLQPQICFPNHDAVSPI